MKRKALCFISIVLSLLLFSACSAIPKSVTKAAEIDESDSELYRAIDSGNLEQAKEAIEDGANINMIKKSVISEENPLILASTKNMDTKIVKYLIENGADVNYTDSSGRSLLMFQAYNTDYNFCELLIKNGAKIDTEDKKGYTALEYVLEHSRRDTSEKNIDDIITMLLDHGAKIRSITLKAALNGVKSDSENRYGVINRILKELINSGNKSELNPALEAAILGESSKINELINADQMKKDDGQQILFYTAAFGNVETIKLLEDKGIDIKSCDNFKSTTLIIASEYGNIEMVKYLINKGIDIEGLNKDNESALFTAVKNDQYDVVKFLINQGANIKPDDKTDVLSEASRNGNIDMLKLIIANGYHLNDKNMKKAMTFACKNSKIDAIKYLLDMGANPDLECLESIIFKDSGGLESAKLLIEHGAKVDGKNSDGRPLELIENKEISEYLIKKGANVNALSVSQSDDSILMKYIMEGDLDMVKLLVENGADLEYKNEGADKDTAIIYAGDGSRHILEYLIQKGANINYQDEKGKTALMRAASVGELNNVKILVNYKADINLKDEDGHTALELAEAKNYKEIVSFLKDGK